MQEKNGKNEKVNKREIEKRRREGEIKEWKENRKKEVDGKNRGVKKDN